LALPIRITKFCGIAKTLLAEQAFKLDHTITHPIPPFIWMKQSEGNLLTPPISNRATYLNWSQTQ